MSDRRSRGRELTPGDILRLLGKVGETPVTAAETYRRITGGADPELAYRDFLGAWAAADRPLRAAMVQSPPLPIVHRHKRWAVLLAASVETLTRQAGLRPPPWVNDPNLRLSRPWNRYSEPRLEPWLRESSPEPFLRRNILSGDRDLIKAGIGERRP